LIFLFDFDDFKFWNLLKDPTISDENVLYNIVLKLISKLQVDNLFEKELKIKI